jgi:PhzF family phenazine biosynthesis protein
MALSIFQVDAFTDTLFGGNPAAVCPLENWLSDELMQKIAAENNLSETVFFVAHTDRYEIRWFTPKVEVDLCGHATLAAAHVIFNFLNTSLDRIFFKSKSGDLIVSRNGDYLTLDFPAVPATPCQSNETIIQAIGISPQEICKGTDYMVVLDSEAQVRRCLPNFHLIEKLDARGLVITARGEKADFVSRWFGPRVGVNEDPVTGSAHCMLAPYWALKLNKTKLYAEQLSTRLGKIFCEVTGDRVLLSGQAVLYLRGEIDVPY